MNKKRTWIHIVIDILDSCSRPVLTTRLMSLTNTNWDNLKRYLNPLISHGLVEKRGKYYEITEKGLSVLTGYEKFESELPPIMRVPRTRKRLLEYAY